MNSSAGIDLPDQMSEIIDKEAFSEHGRFIYRFVTNSVFKCE